MYYNCKFFSEKYNKREYYLIIIIYFWLRKLIRADQTGLESGELMMVIIADKCGAEF